MSSSLESKDIKIMVVDDDPSIGRLMADFLIKEGYQPVIHDEPQTALKTAEKEHFSLVFVDINMPEMSGLELASELKNNDPLSEVVFITGYGSFDNAIQAIKIGAYDYLRKPFGINEIQLCLKRFYERYALKEKARLAEQKYFHLVHNIPSVIFVIQRNFRLDFINRACEGMLGYSPEEAMSDPLWLLGRIHSNDLEKIEKLFLSAFSSGNARFSNECRFIHREGHVIHAIISSMAQEDVENTGKLNKIQGIIVDITDRVFLEKSMVQKEKLKMLSSISAEVAHEIRNPLVSIGGFARRIRKKFPDLHEGDIILRESKRLEDMLQRLEEYLKPVEVSYEECSINSILIHCMERLTHELEKNGSTYQLNLDKSTAVVSIDKDILERIFVELILNALKEMNSGGILYIRTFESDNSLHVEFKSRGHKIEAKDTEPFIMPFSERDQAVGLPISYRLLKIMGGLLSFSRSHEDDMIFTVTIPKKDMRAIVG
ncbi:MAG: response regulator [Deltaproteobacteria bacterium]|nr:response regulator [Deltaproteobacteria bacterium]